MLFGSEENLTFDVQHCFSVFECTKQTVQATPIGSNIDIPSLLIEKRLTKLVF